jgi:hypothetical protein
MRNIAMKIRTQSAYFMTRRKRNTKIGNAWLMPVKTLQQNGSYQDIGMVRLTGTKSLNWEDIDGETPPRIPFGTQIEITVSYHEHDFLNGVDGIVWATYDPLQAETIRGALLVQHISFEAQQLKLDEWLLHLIKVINPDEAQSAIDFIWRDASGMRL